ncbi:hypothetical protein [Tateyamaria sp. syn59]|uniref:hypothetical protein n=1 Tax=Tateyamaria sp. syn59 TaxID=2576942 RepID=UPI0011BEE22A|nr:hypothetical protein [Tateyamaria sp. syn59]
MALLTLMNQCSAVFQTEAFSSLAKDEAFKSHILTPTAMAFFAGGVFGLVSRLCVSVVLPAIVAVRRRAGIKTDVNAFALKHIFELDEHAKPIKRGPLGVWRSGR